MNWDDIRIFLAVARAGQILAAARRLGLNHATVSRRITALETEIGAKLFRRVTTGSELTPAGLRFQAAAERMEADLVGARSEIAGEEDAISGTVRIGAPDGFGVAFLASRLGDLTQAYPGLEIQLVPVPQSFSLSRREADLVITVERPVEGKLVAVKLVDYSLNLYAARTYAEAHGLPADLNQLGAHRQVGSVADLLVSPSLNYAADLPEAAWQPTYAVSSALGQVEAVRAGNGIGILHTFIARQYPELVQLTVAPPVMRAYWLVYHDSARGVRRIQTVVRAIQASVERERAIFQ